MNSPTLKKFRNIALIIVGLGTLGSIGFGYKLYSDLSGCPYGDACSAMYEQMTSYGKYVDLGFMISIIIALIGVALLAIWLVVFLLDRAKQDRVAMTPEQIELRVAEKEYTRAVKEAEKTYKATIKGLEKEVKQAEKAVSAANQMGQRKLAKFHAAALYEDRIETPQGTASFDAGAIQTEASPNGNLNIKTEDFQSLIEGKPEQFEKAREFSSKLQTALSDWPKIKEDKRQAISKATTELEEAKRNQETGAADAEAILSKVKTDTSRVDSARSAMTGNFSRTVEQEMP
ncbi:MAG: hypothetical protein M1309_01980 [Actinobacteria bacterium]|nr:hypothetical protein [Actinomycetota bacterium]